MANGVEKFRKRQQERTAEISKLSVDLSSLKAQRLQLEDEINRAIDTGDTAKAEKLVNQQRDIDVKIEVTQRTIERKSVQNQDLGELVKEANKETADYQKRIDRAEAAIIDAKRVYLVKLLEAAVLVNEAWDMRTAYCSLIDGVIDPSTANLQTRDFDGVSSHLIKWDRQDSDLLREINPEALIILANATKNRTNSNIRFNDVPRDPGVIISKYT